MAGCRKLTRFKRRPKALQALCRKAGMSEAVDYFDIDVLDDL